MTSKQLSPEFFKRACEGIWGHKWSTDYAWRSYFSKFRIIFDYDDTKEFNIEIEEFWKKWFDSPLNYDLKIKRMLENQRVMRIRNRGERIIVNPYDVLKDLENLKSWCLKKLNEYYKLYGLSIDGIDFAQIKELD